MATQEKTWNVANRLHSQKDSDNPEVNHIIAGADEIYDDEKGAKQSDINAQNDAALSDRYTKAETYSKEQLDALITTPDVEYVNVVATNATTAVTDVLPATGEANTIYRVGNWNGTQYDPTMYALLAWNGTAYVCLAVRSFVGEVYDISVNHPDGQGNPTPYADLTAALGTDGANIPADIRRGGMSIQFIKGNVQSSDNKYVQFQYMGTETTGTPNPFLDTNNWKEVDGLIIQKYLDNSIEKTYSASGYNLVTFPLLSSHSYIIQNTSESTNISLNENNGGFGPQIIAVSAGKKKIFTPSQTYTNFYIYRSSSAQCTVKIEEMLLPEIADLFKNGYIYGGKAEPTGTPVSGKVFYLAIQSGTYTNYGNKTLTFGINILRCDGVDWYSEQLIEIDNTVTDGSNNLVTSNAVYDKIDVAISTLEKKYLNNEYKNTFTSSGSSTINYPLVGGKTYLLSNQSTSTAVQLYKDSIGAGNLLITLSAGKTDIPFVPDANYDNFILYRNSSTQTVFTIKEMLIPERVDKCEEDIGEINNVIEDLLIDSNKLTKNYSSSGYNIVDYPLAEGKDYYITANAQGSVDIGIYTNNGGSMGTLLLNFHMSSSNTNETKKFTSTITASDIIVYRNSATSCSVVIEAEKLPLEIKDVEHSLQVEIDNTNGIINEYVVDLDKVTKNYSSSGYSVVTYPLEENKEYLITASAQGAMSLLMTSNNGGSMGSTLLTIKLTETESTVVKKFVSPITAPDFIVYRNAATSCSFAIKKINIPSVTDSLLQEQIDVINNIVLSESLSKDFTASGATDYNYNIVSGRRYELTVMAEGTQDIGLYAGNTLTTLIAQCHTTPNKYKSSVVFTANDNLSQVNIYRNKSIATTVLLQEYKVPQATDLLEEKVDVLDANVDKVKYVTVKQDGTGDFTTIRAAIDYIKDASERNKYCILVHEGVYDVFADYTDEEIEQANYPETGYNEYTFVGPKLTDGISIKGVGAKEKVILDGTLDPKWTYDQRRNISTLNVKGNCNIENLTIIANNLRYCVHDDFNYRPAGTFHRVVKDVILKPYGTANNTSYGTGMQGGAMYGVFDNVDFGHRFGIHTNPEKLPSSVIVRDCKGVIAGFNDMGSDCTITMLNNSFEYIEISDSTQDHVQKLFVNGVGNDAAAIIAPSGYKYELGSVFKVYPANNLVAGKAVKRNGTEYQQEYAVTNNPLLCEGIVLFKDEHNAYIQRAGCFTSSTVSQIAGGVVGDYLTLDNDGYITYTGATQANAVAVVISVIDSNVTVAKLLTK